MKKEIVRNIKKEEETFHPRYFWICPSKLFLDVSNMLILLLKLYKSIHIESVYTIDYWTAILIV